MMIISLCMVSGIFIVFIIVLLGNIVMCVIVVEGYFGVGFMLCMIYGYGEIEDYMINIVCFIFVVLIFNDVGVCFGNMVILIVIVVDFNVILIWWDVLIGGI